MRKDRGFTLIELLIVVAIIGIIAAIAIPNLLNAIDRGKQKRTMADLRSIGTATESYAVDNNFYVRNVSEAALTSTTSPVTFLQPNYIKKCPINDGWAIPIRFESNATGSMYTVGSTAKNGGDLDLATTTPIPTTNFEDDIIFSNGSFVQWPEGAQQ